MPDLLFGVRSAAEHSLAEALSAAASFYAK
jgi:hypothetical protein